MTTLVTKAANISFMVEQKSNVQGCDGVMGADGSWSHEILITPAESLNLSVCFQLDPDDVGFLVLCELFQF